MIDGCHSEQQQRKNLRDIALAKVCMKQFCKEIYGASESNTIRDVLQNALGGQNSKCWRSLSSAAQRLFPSFFLFFFCRFSFLITSHFCLRASQLICFSTRRQKRQRALHPTTHGLLLYL